PKSKLLSLTASLLGAAMLLSACSGGEAAGENDENVVLRVATGLSPQHAFWEGGIVPWMDRVEELTDGQVEFESFTSGELVAVPDEGEAVLNGTVDLAIVLPVYEPDQYPMAEITMLPLNHSDTVIGS